MLLGMKFVVPHTRHRPASEATNPPQQAQRQSAGWSTKAPRGEVVPHLKQTFASLARSVWQQLHFVVLTEKKPNAFLEDSSNEAPKLSESASLSTVEKQCLQCGARSTFTVLQALFQVIPVTEPKGLMCPGSATRSRSSLQQLQRGVGSAASRTLGKLASTSSRLSSTMCSSPFHGSLSSPLEAVKNGVGPGEV